VFRINYEEAYVPFNDSVDQLMEGLGEYKRHVYDPPSMIQSHLGIDPATPDGGFSVLNRTLPEREEADSIASEKEFGEVFHERLTDLLTDLSEVFEESPETLGVVESKLEQALEETKELQREETETESTPEHILIIYGKGFTDTRKRMKELDTDKYDKVYLSWSKDMVNSIFLENVDNFVHLEGCRREQIETGS
jgi:hypothetical protein